MLRKIFISGLLLTVSSASLAETSQPLCVLDPVKMPESWQPSAEMRKSLRLAPWSEAEAKDAEYAKKTGVDEMIAYLQDKPSARETLWGDAIEALIQVTYASANTPEFDAKVHDAARNNLTALIELFFKNKPDPDQVSCKDFERVFPLAISAHSLYPAGDPKTARVVKSTNAAYRACGSLKAATGFDHHKILATKQADPEILLEVYIWALWFMEAELYPDIELPAETREYGKLLWNYFKNYDLADADEFEEGPWDDRFVAMADLAPHLAHIPTGTHRFPLYVEDHPDLYRYHRENFYAVMQLGELDLFASFVDALRQYGCTPENDVQVRDGTRFLLKIFHDNSDRWMNYRQEGETDAEIDDYDIVHYPWTAVLGLRDRKPLQPEPGTYGGIIRRWLPPPS
jgi:hypothetical protein